MVLWGSGGGAGIEDVAVAPGGLNWGDSGVGTD